MGKSNNFTRYRKLYDDLYHETADKLRATEAQLKTLQKNYEDSLCKINMLERRIKTQQQIIEELEEKVENSCVYYKRRWLR